MRLLKAEGQPGLNKGYSFVVFANRDAASKAVEALGKADYKDFKDAKVMRRVTRTRKANIALGRCAHRLSFCERQLTEVPVADPCDAVNDEEPPVHRRHQEGRAAGVAAAPAEEGGGGG